MGKHITIYFWSVSLSQAVPLQLSRLRPLFLKFSTSLLTRGTLKTSYIPEKPIFLSSQPQSNDADLQIQTNHNSLTEKHSRQKFSIEYFWNGSVQGMDFVQQSIWLNLSFCSTVPKIINRYFDGKTLIFFTTYQFIVSVFFLFWS